jgi:hypothetical protein
VRNCSGQNSYRSKAVALTSPRSRSQIELVDILLGVQLKPEAGRKVQYAKLQTRRASLERVPIHFFHRIQTFFHPEAGVDGPSFVLRSSRLIIEHQDLFLACTKGQNTSIPLRRS